MSDVFWPEPTPEEQRQAAVLDDAIDGVLGGGGVALDPVLDRIAAAFHADVPARLAPRPTRVVWRPARIAAAVLAATLFSHAYGQLFLGHWVARQIHGTYDAHSYTEGGLAMLGLAVFVALAVWRPRWLTAAAAIAGPVGVGYAVHGASEITGLTWGGALHGSEGLAGLAVILLTWRARRYGRGPNGEEGA
jgi:hypothetical protein